MEVESNMTLKKQSETDMAKLENTIDKLTNINGTNRPPKEIETRIRFLLTKVTKIQKLIEDYDQKITVAKEVISTSWVPEEDE